MMKKIFLVLVLVLFPFNCFALVTPTDDFYINDYANILSDDVEQYILSRSVDLESKTGAQIVVVTVNNLEEISLEDYATKLFREFEIGDSVENNGLLLLLSLEEREFRVEVGYGLEGVLTDGLTGRYQDEYIIPYLKNDDWDTGLKTGYTAFYKKLCDYYEIDALDDTIIITDFDEYLNNEEDSVILTYWILLISAFSIIGFAQGSYCKKINSKKPAKLSTFYIVISFLLLMFLIAMIILNSSILWIPVLVFKEIFYLIGKHKSKSGSSIGGSRYRSYSSRSSSSSHSSSIRFSGGGGTSGSGGSSRRF